MSAVTVNSAVTVAATLRATAGYLERHGWIPGCYYDATSLSFTPAACMVGAIGIVCYGGPVDAPAQMFDDPGFPQFEAALGFLEFFLLFEHDFVSAYEFNDTKGRQASEVVDMLRAAADAWELTRGGAA